MDDSVGPSYRFPKNRSYSLNRIEPLVFPQSYRIPSLVSHNILTGGSIVIFVDFHGIMKNAQKSSFSSNIFNVVHVTLNGSLAPSLWNWALSHSSDQSQIALVLCCYDRDVLPHCAVLTMPVLLKDFFIVLKYIW